MQIITKAQDNKEMVLLLNYETQNMKNWYRKPEYRNILILENFKYDILNIIIKSKLIIDLIDFFNKYTILSKIFYTLFPSNFWKNASIREKNIH